MILMRRGGLVAQLLDGAAAEGRIAALRGACFRGGPGRPDFDAVDSICRHLVISRRTAAAPPVACLRILPLASGQELGRSYAARHYDLAGLAGLQGAMLEVGRFCIAPGAPPDPDIPRLAWAALARLSLDAGAAWLLGCTSFPGTDPEPFREAFALLAARHRLPPPLAPGHRAPETVPLAGPGAQLADPRRARARIPALLRSYLAMGAMVSDHAVIDRDLGTLHVFTLLDIARMPPARRRALTALAGNGTRPAT